MRKTIPLPANVSAGVTRYNTQIQGLIDQRQGYIQGAMEVLGVNVESTEVDLTGMTYTVEVPDEEPESKHGDGPPWYEVVGGKTIPFGRSMREVDAN